MRVPRQLVSMLSARLSTGAAGTRSAVTGLPPGPLGIGVKTVQIADASRTEEDGLPRRLMTEVWYPAVETADAPPNAYRDFLGPATPEIVAAAEAGDAIGGYADGLTISGLDASWPNAAVRDAAPAGEAWPLVIFSHGSGAFRASYVWWTEWLASNGFVVVACDHPGSARFTVLDGAVVTPGGPRSTRPRMEADRVADVRALLDACEAGKIHPGVDAKNAAVTGMSFGGWTAAAYAETGDARVKAVVLQCPSLNSSDGGKLSAGHASAAPACVMVGAEDTVIGEAGNAAARSYAATHAGPAGLFELVRGGHCSFTSCDLYTPTYGNGIGPSASLSNPGATYDPWPIADQHAAANAYGLAFLNAHLKPPGHPLHDADAPYGAAYLAGPAHFDAAEVTWTAF